LSFPHRQLAALGWIDRTAHAAGLLAALEGMADGDAEGAALVWREMLALARRPESRSGRAVRMMMGGSHADPAMLAVVQAAGTSGLVRLDDRAGICDLPIGPLAMAVETLAGMDAPAYRAAAIGVIGLLDGASGERLVETRLGPAFVDEPMVVDAALATLEDLSRDSAGSACGASAARTAMLAKALLSGLATMAGHRREEVALAVVRGLGAGRHLGSGFAAGLTTLTNEREHPAGTAIRRAIRRSILPSAGAAAWTLMKFPGLVRACADRIAGDENAAAAAARAGHLAANPARAAGLSLLVTEKKTITPTLRGMLCAGLDERSRIGGVRLIEAMGVPSRELDATLGDGGGCDGGGVADPAPAVRLAIVRALAANSARPTALLDLCFDQDARVAASAALAVLGQCERGMVADAQREKVVAALVRSPHARVRALVAASLSETGVVPGAGAIRSGGPRMVEAQRLLVAHELALKSGAANRHIVLAGVVTAIGTLSDAESAGVLVRHVTDWEADVRVRSNAIDALVRRGRRIQARGAGGSDGREDVLGLLKPLRDAREHRVRACAARGLMVLGEPAAADRGCATLLSMLADGRAEHRAAGLWLAERMAATVAQRPEMVDAVIRSAREPGALPDMSKHRPARTLGRVEGEVRAAWTLRTGERDERVEAGFGGMIAKAAAEPEQCEVAA